MAEGIETGSIRIFTDKFASGIRDAFRDTDDDGAVLRQGGSHILCELFKIEMGLRQIDEYRVVPLVFTGESAGSRYPAGVAAHQLYDGDGFLLIDRGVQNDFPDRIGYIFCGASVAGGMVGENEVVIYGFRNTDEPDLAVVVGGVAGQLADGVHGIVASDIEEVSDVHLPKLLKQSRIEW